jgi:putative tricarboxylic transport membrane protein
VVWEGLALAFSPVALLTILGGVFLGIVIGIIPGIGAGVGLALMIPLIFGAPPLVGLMLLLALWAADGYGASLTSILLNVPGGAGAVPTCFDGYPMAQQGKAGKAIGMAMMASMFAGIVGTIVLMVAAPPLAEVAVKIGPAEYTILALFGMVAIGGLTGEEPLKGLISAGLGLMISFMGYDLITGFVRYSFGWTHLYDGIDFSLALIGLFAIGSLVDAAQEGGAIAGIGKTAGKVWDGIKETFKYPGALIRGTLVGVIGGVLPGMGVSIAAPVAYDLEKRVSKHPERFGKGAPEGVIAPEAANNSVQPAALIPTFTLSIPGSTTAAVFLGALMMYGFTPGLNLFKTQGTMVWALFWGIIIACIAFVIIGTLFANFFAKLTLVPIEYLAPVTLVTCFIGAYSINGNVWDMLLVLGMGLVGFLMARLKYPVAPAILAIVLGPMLEKNYFRAVLISSGDPSIFFHSIFAKILWALVIFMLFWPPLQKALRQRRARRAEATAAQ